MAQNIKQLDNQLTNIISQSANLFANKGQGMNTGQQIMQILQQYEYIKKKVGAKPEYMQEFIKNYQEVFGIINQSMGFTAQKVASELQQKNNMRIQQEFNKLEMLMQAINNGFEKQILIYMEDEKENNAIKIKVDESIEFLRRNLEATNKNQKSPITSYTFESDNKFRSHIINQGKTQPIILITKRSILLNNAIVELINELNSQKHFRLEGLICICPNQDKLISTKRSFEDSTIPFKFVDNNVEVQRLVYDMINKNVFLRILSLSDYVSYMTSTKVTHFSESVMAHYQKNKKLSDFSPKMINYQAKLKSIANSISTHNIAIFNECYNDNAITRICSDLSTVFNNNDENIIAENLVKLYTSESPYFKLLNSCLNVLNESLITELEPIIIPLYLSLLIVKRQEESVFNTSKDNEVLLYRGTTIPSKSSYLLDKNQQILLPAFSSFTSSEEVALKFMKQQKTEPDTLKVLFVVKCKRNLKDPNINPKYLKHLSSFKNEEEYLFPPFSVFKVFQNTQSEDMNRVEILF